MTMKKVMKIVIMLLVATLVVMMLSQVTFAADQDVDLTQFSHKDNSGASQAAQNIIGTIISIAQVIGAGVAIIMLIVLAIQYISASPEGKAEIKKNSTIYIVGAVILFSASGVLGIVKQFALTNIGKEGSES
jgi:nitric oxide reductase large subunit